MPNIGYELLTNIYQIRASPTPHVHLEIEPFPSCVVSLVQYTTEVGLFLFKNLFKW